MTDHSSHDHPATPAARRRCRTAFRADIKDAQVRYMQIELQDDRSFAIREYEATIDIFSMKWGIELAAAYELIENGPVIH